MTTSATRLLSVLFVLALGHTASAAAPAELRVMSYNVRLSSANDGEDAWAKRIELFFAPIPAFAPDLIGFQEVLADQHDAIVARLGDLAFSGVARNDGKRSGEWSLVGYRRERFELLDSGTFWLSETPEVAGSKSWDAAITRICSWVRLRDRTSGRDFVFANTHFDHRGTIARLESAKLLSARLPKLAAGGPAILVGDFNINEDTPAYGEFVRPTAPGAIRWIDAYRAVHPVRSPEEASFNGFKGTVKGSRIDFVFHTDHFTARSATIDRMSRAGRYPSDHYPVTAVLRLK
ncbi:MAG: endonuclease/exonuclease/phosphatase family protein [Opitutaceae bacterium]|nr:endonuclease/exonuclease/phosphatase family protein [Opitutaceae bacterium]